MTTAADILENAAELTQRYASDVTAESIAKAKEAQREERERDGVSDDGHPAARVYVLVQSGTILGVLSSKQRALDEAHQLMHVYGGVWQEMIPNRFWRSGPWRIEVSPHDVR